MANVTTLNVNGKKLPLDVDSEASLLSVLRNDLSLTGTKYGCGEAQCGACTVLIDGQPTRSCITPVGKASGKQITTIEGLEKDTNCTHCKKAFLKADAMQCGYCTSGISCRGHYLQKTRPTRRDHTSYGRQHLCAAPMRIVTAIERSGNPKVAK